MAFDGPPPPVVPLVMKSRRRRGRTEGGMIGAQYLARIRQDHAGDQQRDARGKTARRNADLVEAQAFEADHARHHHAGLAGAVGAERRPGDQHGSERQQAREERRQAPGEMTLPDMRDQQIEAVQAAPDDERVIGAVPEAAEQHGGHEIDRAMRLAAPVAAERNVDVVA